MNLMELVRDTEIYQDIAAEGRKEGLEKGREEGREKGRRETVLKLLRKLTARRFPTLELGAEVERIHDLDALEELCSEVIGYDDPATLQRHIAELAARETNGHSALNGVVDKPLS